MNHGVMGMKISICLIRKNWKILGVEDKDPAAVLDGDVNTSWYQDKGIKLPCDLITDLREIQNLTVFYK